SVLTKAIQEIAYISGSFKDSLIAWLADATNGITKLFAEEVHTDKLCVKKSDGTDICLTGDELAAIVSSSGSSSSSSGPVGGGSSSEVPSPSSDGTASSTPETTPETISEPTPAENTPAPEPTPDVVTDNSTSETTPPSDPAPVSEPAPSPQLLPSSSAEATDGQGSATAGAAETTP
ncbi:MAG: hypothetical protein AAB758_02695, partial [Patescibacteria group bacterium]